MTTIDAIRERLTEIRLLGAARDILASGMVQGIDTRNGTVRIHLAPPAMSEPALNALIADIRRAVGALEGVTGVDVQIATPAAGGAAPPNSQGELGPLPGVRDIIAVASTKGGVGKSTLAVNLALGLARLGQRVGFMDADVYGPSAPIMFGLSGRPGMSEQKRILPLEKFGLKIMSIGFFLDDSSPVIWRGPMVMGLVRQFLKDVEWGALDTLVIDMPPGTGDAQLTLVQQVPLAGAVIVTTPQEVATLDVERGIAMFHQVNTPVLGIIENMSDYECPHCGKHEDVFGAGGAERIAATFGVPVLGQIPLLAELRTSGDTGQPLVFEQPTHPVSQRLVQIAQRVADAVEAARLANAPPTIIG